jgi:dihydroxyacetone kinase
MTSLNAPGFSISLLNISSIQRHLASTGEPPIDGDVVAAVLEYLDDPTDAIGWPRTSSYQRLSPSLPRDLRREEAEADQFVSSFSTYEKGEQLQLDGTRDVPYDPMMVENAMRTACESVLTVETDLTRFDTIVGDGDCGQTFANGAKGEWTSPPFQNFLVFRFTNLVVACYVC